MKKLSAILLLAVACLLTGCWEQQIHSNPNDPLLRYHFAGMKAFLQGTNGTRLQKIWALPDTIALKEEAMTKLARAPFHVLQASLPPGSIDEGSLIKPLLDDLVNTEHFVEAKSAGDKVEFVVGIKLADDRAKVWDLNLQKVAKDWKFGKPAPGNISGPKGWETKGNGGQLAFTRAGNWTLISFGTVPALKLLPEFLGKPNEGGNLDGALLELTADLTRLRKWVPLLADYPLPPAHLRIEGKGENLRTALQLRYSDNLHLATEPWVFPKKAINDPLVSFTVGRGLSQLLGESRFAKDLGLKQLPNQFCMWSLEHDFPMTYVALPTPNPTNVINHLAQTIPKEASAFMPGHMGDFFWISNRAELFWRNLPFVSPRVYALNDGANHFVMMGIYPRPALTNPPPAELFAEVESKPKLLYYDWEVTQARVIHANQLYQLYDIVNNRRPYGTNVVAQRWLPSLAPNLGNTITEISISAPNELSLVRKSQLGFTAFELVTLARWINSKSFPFEFEPAPPLKARSADAANSSTKPGISGSKNVVPPPAGPLARPVK